MQNSSTSLVNAKESARFQEWSYIQGRKFLLLLLALGSLLITFKIGSYVGNLIFPFSPTLMFLIQNLFVLLGYLGIDWVLMTALAGASTVTENEEKQNRSVWFFAVAALLSTVGLSIASNFFISQEMAGKSHLPDYNNQVKQAMANDTLLKMKAFVALEKAGIEEQEQLKWAKTEKKRLIIEAVQTGSKSWQNDFHLHKNNLKAWFWNCTKCPKEYKRYRERIKTAMKEGDQLVAKASQYSKSVQNSLSPTLSYQLATDSVLLSVKQNITELEEMRKSKEQRLNMILFVLTISTGILAFILSIVLRIHRKEHGQQITENHALPVMIFHDVLNRLVSSISDLIYTILSVPFHYLKHRGFIKTYKIDKKQFLEIHTETDTNASEKRLCLNCKTDITHKRSDAKYCTDKCRMTYHNFVPGRNRDSPVLT